MAISPPSDIVLDVARAVEPTGVAAARAELVRRAGKGIAHAFSLAETGSATARASEKASASAPFKKFEAMVLQTFIQEMLPKGTQDVYGKGIAGDMWKSQLAEKLATVMSERGGIGISDRILGDHYQDGDQTVPVGPVSGGPEKADADRQSMLSTALVQQMQLKLARTIAEDQALSGEPKN